MKNKLPFRVYNPTPEAKKLLEGSEPQVVVEGLLNQLHSVRQSREADREWYELIIEDLKQQQQIKTQI